MSLVLTAWITMTAWATRVAAVQLRTPAPSGTGTNNSRAAAVREAVEHLWSGYRAAAWGSDEVQPISGQPMLAWGGVGMMILDSMDTLWLAGMQKEFAEAEDWVANMNFAVPFKASDEFMTSFFETTIRGLGGLLSAYALSHKPVFLERAADLGDRLMHAFPTAEGKKAGLGSQQWPAFAINVAKPEETMMVSPDSGKESLADAGSNLLEFTYLSQATGQGKYRDAARDVENRLIDLAGKTGQHLAPKQLEGIMPCYGSDRVTVGAQGDSYFEYLMKGYLQSGESDRRLLREWKAAMEQMRKDLIRTSKDGRTYISREASTMVGGVLLSPAVQEMDHLSCFMPGSLALAAHSFPAKDVEPWWLPTAEAIAETCYAMYSQSPSGLAADVSSFESGHMKPSSAPFLLRPETLESLFYLYRVTGNSTYQDWSWQIFQAINKQTRTKFGFANVKDAGQKHVQLDDSEETYMGAETLKYALLAQLPSSALSLKDFVLNTEGHPLPLGR